MDQPVASYLAKNIKQLREARGLTQDQLAKISQVPRPTWANLESGESNPTLSVLVKVAASLQVSLESLITPPRSTTRFYTASELPFKSRGSVLVRQLLPDVLGGIELDRMEFPVGTRMIGMPHKTGTREYLTCESGKIELSVSAEKWVLSPGDVLVFRGDQKHSYANLHSGNSVGYSIILIGQSL